MRGGQGDRDRESERTRETEIERGREGKRSRQKEKKERNREGEILEYMCISRGRSGKNIDSTTPPRLKLGNSERVRE